MYETCVLYAYDVSTICIINVYYMYILYTISCILHSVSYTVYTIYNIPFNIYHIPYTLYYVLCITPYRYVCMPYTIYYVLPTTYFTLHCIYCVLHIIHSNFDSPCFNSRYFLLIFEHNSAPRPRTRSKLGQIKVAGIPELF